MTGILHDGSKIVTSQANPFSDSRFLLSAARLDQLPDDGQPEVAFAGRSNAGKSTALNALCGARSLARVSKTPGRTQLINLFEIRGGGRLVDLPGYGFAQVPLAIRAQWGALVGGYIERRASLSALVVIMDVRHPLTPLDTQMLDWAQAHGRPVHILLTKADKLSRGAGLGRLTEVREALAQRGTTLSAQLFSAPAKIGIQAARDAVAGHLNAARGGSDG